MLKFLKLLIKRDTTSSGNEEVIGRPIEVYLQQELDVCSYIKSECHKTALDHLTHVTNLNKTGNKLTAEEKKFLGINARLAITHELVSILTSDGVKQKDPKEILSRIYYRATFAKNRDDSLNEYKSAGIKKYTLMNCGDGRDCQWCSLQQGVEISVNENINELINNNCTCDSHCRCVMQPVIQF
ncbi:hypothetical protein [Oceanimonas smirnovii]|uniref:hypothetical protein n=1 Tax=Oceanimonas smirnovii TaxID=264574 RepID=UPI0012E9CBE4|nr:hypothetical protein [Oceanimonas smirnovii]